MLKFITNMQISRRLLLAFLLAALIPGIVISVLGLTFAKGQTERGQIAQTNINALKFTTAAGADLPKLKLLLYAAYQEQYTPHRSALSTQAQQDIAQMQTLTEQFDAATRQYIKDYAVATSPKMIETRRQLKVRDPHTQLPGQQQAAFNQVQTNLWPIYKSLQAQTVTAILQKAPVAQTRNLLDSVDTAYAPLVEKWGEVSDTTATISYTVVSVPSSQTNPLILITLFAFLATIIIVTAIGYVIYHTITVPLHQLATLTRRISKGDTNARATIDGNDEIFLVATSMNNMLDNIVHLIQETQLQRDILQGQVEKLVSEVSGVGEGDLRVQAEVTSDTLGVLADSFNYMVEELGSLVVRVKTVASEVENSTRAILDRMTQLVETGSRQIDQINEAANKVAHMTDSNRQVAERAKVLYEVARVARIDAQVGRESLEQAVKGMGRINENVQATAGHVQTLGERSREIDEIVEAISSIAHQTNRLALDAAIQAAMAGENGKGFGAVAADIRRLAERAKDQAGLITRIVRSVREDIGSVAISMQDTQRESATGTRLTQEAGVALESIFAAVEHQAREIENINQMAIQQLQSSSSVAHIMQGVTETTQQSSYSTREASYHMERLARLVEQLRASVEAFKLREDQKYQVPASQIMIHLDDEQESPLTVSGVFRTVTATLQPTSQLASKQITSSSYSTPPTSDSEYLAHTPMPTKTAAKGDGTQNWNSLPRSEEWSTSNQSPNSHQEW